MAYTRPERVTIGRRKTADPPQTPRPDFYPFPPLSLHIFLSGRCGALPEPSQLDRRTRTLVSGRGSKEAHIHRGAFLLPGRGWGDGDMIVTRSENCRSTHYCLCRTVRGRTLGYELISGSFPFSRTELNGDSTALSGSAESTRWSEHGVTSREKEAPKCASGHKRMGFDGVACADRQRCPSDTFGGFFERAFGVVGARGMEKKFPECHIRNCRR